MTSKNVWRAPIDQDLAVDDRFPFVLWQGCSGVSSLTSYSLILYGQDRGACFEVLFSQTR